jgi:hypothetical protein
MTSTIATATIEVLTAQVRVLMVGSRQVTLSVYRQLDTIDYEQAHMLMGRVRDPNKGEGIIGSDKDGNLVRVDKPERPDNPVDLQRDLRDSKRQMQIFPEGSAEWERARDQTAITEVWLADLPINIGIYRGKMAEIRDLPLIVLAGLT